MNNLHDLINGIPKESMEHFLIFSINLWKICGGALKKILNIRKIFVEINDKTSGRVLNS